MSVNKKGRIVAFLGLSVWILGIFAAPLFYSRGDAGAQLIYGIFGRVCHQLPGRSLSVYGFPLAVCARCSAIYMTGWLLLLYYQFRSDVRLLPVSVYLVLSSPMIIDFLFEKFSLYQDLILLRIITGALFGIAIFHLLVVSLQPDTKTGIGKKAAHGESKDYKRRGNRRDNRCTAQYNAGN